MDYLSSQVFTEIHRVRGYGIDLEPRCGYAAQCARRCGIPALRALTAQLLRNGRES